MGVQGLDQSSNLYNRTGFAVSIRHSQQEAKRISSGVRLEAVEYRNRDVLESASFEVA
jgi:hypothetical protein